MGVSGKFLFLFVALIALQGICAWPHFNIWKWKNLGYEINKASDDAEKDVRKDLLNVKNNIWKDSNKLIMKAKENNGIAMCIVKTQQEVLTEVDKISVNAVECIENIRTKADAVNDDNHDPRQLNAMKNEMKNDIKRCRNSAKDEFKINQKIFSAKLSSCLYENVRQEEDDTDDSSRSF